MRAEGGAFLDEIAAFLDPDHPRRGRNQRCRAMAARAPSRTSDPTGSAPHLPRLRCGPDPFIPLTATIPLMPCCPEHGCRLEAEDDIALAAAMGEPPPCRTAPEHIQALDRLTRMGMTTGTVGLPRRAVQSRLEMAGEESTCLVSGRRGRRAHR